MEEGPRKFGPWSQTDYLLVQLIDAVNRNTYATAVAGHLEDPQPPKPFPRPGLVVKESAEPRNSEAVVLYLEKLRSARRG